MFRAFQRSVGAWSTTVRCRRLISPANRGMVRSGGSPEEPPALSAGEGGNRFMTRFSALFLAAVFAVGLSACSEKKSEAPATPPAAEKASPAPAAKTGDCPSDVSEADRYKYPGCGKAAAAPAKSDDCPADVSEADRYKYPGCSKAAGAPAKSSECPVDVSEADRAKYPGCK